MMTKTLTEPLSVGREREVHEFVRGQREVLRVLDMGGAADTALAVAIRETLDRLGATLAASREARQAEETAQRRIEDQRRANQEEREREDNELQARAAAWLGERLADGAAKRADLERDAEAAGVARHLGAAAREAGVRELDGAFLFGTSSPDARVPFWTLGAPRPGVDRPAAV